MIVGVDIDGVCAALGQEWLHRYNVDWNDDLCLEDIKTWAIHEYVKPECGQKIYDYLNAAIYLRVEPVTGALMGVRALRELGHRVIFVTSSPRGTQGAKLDWLLTHGFLEGQGEYGDGRVYPDYIECSDKALIACHALVDDRASTIASFPGHGLLFADHHNGEAQDRLPCARTWDEVVSWVVDLEKAMALHPTEQRCPRQTHGFRQIVDRLYAVHLDKNADYSPANILGTGEIGGVVRLWDKMARLLSLEGFNIEVKFLGYTGPKAARNESLDDTLIDLANYAIILKLLREGNWGC
jgi:5'(3')-deoxyribonucleotidase